MGKFGCRCGNVLSNVHQPTEINGRILSEKSDDEFFEDLAAIIDDYIEHLGRDDVPTWRAKYFNEQYPTNLTAGEMLHDVLTGRFWNLTLDMWECDQCGRVWIEESVNANSFCAYSFDEPLEKRPKVLGLNKS